MSLRIQIYPLFFLYFGRLADWVDSAPTRSAGPLHFLNYQGITMMELRLRAHSGVTLIHSNQVFLCSLRAALYPWVFEETPKKGTRFPSMDEVEVYYDFAGGLRESILN